MSTAPATTDSMPDVPVNRDRNYGFVMGLIAGSVVGAGLGILFAPRAVLDLRKRAADSARHLGDAASDQYQRASAAIGDAVDEITGKGRGARDDLADAVGRGANDAERSAENARTGR